MKHPQRCVLLLLSAAVMGLSGCAVSSLLKFDRDELTWAGPETPAVRMVTIWEPAEGRGVDGMPTRGFAGQILFIGTEARSLAVKGDVAVYVFDDVGTPEEQAKPIHRFDFSSDAWNIHRHQGSLGTTYNVFIPYTREGNYFQTKCSLMVRLRSADGELNSELISVTLPGPKRKKESVVTQADEDSIPGTPDEIASLVEANYRQLQAAKRSAETAGADGAIHRRSEAIGTIKNDRGRAAISDQFPAGESSPVESAALQQKIAQLEAQLQQIQGTNRSNVRHVGHQSPQWNDPFQQFEREQLGRHAQQQPAIDERGRDRHPLSGGSAAGRASSARTPSLGDLPGGHRSAGNRAVDAFEEFPGESPVRTGTSGRLRLGASSTTADAPAASARTGQFSDNPLFDDFNDSSASSIGAARSTHPLMD